MRIPEDGARGGRAGARDGLARVPFWDRKQLQSSYNGFLEWRRPSCPPPPRGTRTHPISPGRERMNSYFLISRRPARTLHVDCLFLVEPSYNITMACFQFCWYYFFLFVYRTRIEQTSLRFESFLIYLNLSICVL